MQSQDERDAEGFAARKERDGSVKEFASEELTDRFEGEELKDRRALRPPDERFSRLEDKHDELKKDVEKKHDELKKDVSDVRSDVKALSGQVSDTRSAVSGAVGQLAGQEKLLTETLAIVKKTHDREADREHVTFTATVDVDRAKELAKVEVDKVEGIAKVEVDKEEKLDTIDAKKKKRELIFKGVGLFTSGGGIVELLHRLGVL
jgi:hypothetical protein